MSNEDAIKDKQDLYGFSKTVAIMATILYVNGIGKKAGGNLKMDSTLQGIRDKENAVRVECVRTASDILYIARTSD